MFDHAQRQRLLYLLQQHAFIRGQFVLSSGLQSSYYLDARRVTLMAEGSALVGAAFLDALDSVEVDAVAGLTLGADPIVASIAVRAGLQGRSLDGLIVRKEAKRHGAGRQIEGPWRPGLRIAIVDDTSTTGESSLLAARTIRDAGGEVIGIWQLIDREQGARAAAEAAGYAFQSVFTASEFIQD